MLVVALSEPFVDLADDNVGESILGDFLNLM